MSLTASQYISLDHTSSDSGPKPVKNSFLKAFGNDRIDSDASITIWVQRITPFAFKDRDN